MDERKKNFRHHEIFKDFHKEIPDFGKTFFLFSGTENIQNLKFRM